MKEAALFTTEYRQAVDYLTTLMACAMYGRQAPEKPEGCSWEQIFVLAAQNCLEGLTFFGLKGLKDLPSEELYRYWKQVRDFTVYKVLNFQAEQERILGIMEEKGLSVLPLKGVVVADCYPQPGMRTMADNDVLFGYVEQDPEGGYQFRGGSEDEQKALHEEARKAIQDLMLSEGYELKTLGATHDCYDKPPMYSFEMHHCLAAPGNPCYEYYKNPWKHAVLREGKQCRYTFSPEDRYIYLCSHAFKHYDGSKCGLRFLADRQMYLRVYGDEMDRAYTDRELSRMGILEFERTMGRLAEGAFGTGEPLSDEEERFLCALVRDGTYGTVGSRVERSVEKKQRDGQSRGRAVRSYLWDRAFPSKETCALYFPFFARHRLLMPALFVYRLAKGLARHPSALWKEWKTLFLLK